MSHEVALFILNSTSQLYEKEETLAAAQHVIVDPSMSATKIQEVTPAKLYSYFRADAVGLQGADNLWWNDFRATMKPHLYHPTVLDPDGTACLLKPSMQAAETLALAMIRTYETQEWDGLYLDQAWFRKPRRFVDIELPYWHTNRTDAEARFQIQLRWEMYLRSILEILLYREIPAVILNCAGIVPFNLPRETPNLTIAIEVNEGTTLQDAAVTAMSYGNDTRSLLWFGGVGLTNRIIEGRRL